MKRKTMGLLALALLLSLLSGCGAKPLPDGMEEEAVGDAARAVVAQLTAGEYQAVADAFREDIRQANSVTADTVEAAMATVAEAGVYVSTTDVLAVGGSSKVFDEPYGVALLYSEHESKDVVYEMSFDTDLALIGLAVKLR